MSSTDVALSKEPKTRRTQGPPPEWAIERAIKSVGRVPAALGKLLDRAAKLPLLGPVVRLFSTVTFGLIILSLIALYIAIGSGFANLRATLEMTDLEFFNAWPMRILLILLVVDLSIVTLRRIPLTLFKLGSWTVHTGILTLIGGSAMYFGLKHEGSARIYLNQTISACYDITERALYAYPVDEQGKFDPVRAIMTPIPSGKSGLPFFHERLAQDGNPVDIPLGNAGLTALHPELKDVSIKVTGYYPAAVLREVGQREGLPGETGAGPGVEMTLDSERGPFGGSEWLIANSPAQRVLEAETLPFALEYLHRPTPERLRELQASFEGPMGITVRIPKLGLEKTYAAKAGVPIAIEGSAYTLTPGEIAGNPMISKGYEGAFSTSLMVAVERQNPDGTKFNFERQSLFRYPERSPDWVIENGQRKRKQEGVDADIQIIFHDASRPQYWIIEDADGKTQLITRTGEGQSTTRDFSPDQTAPLIVKGFSPMRVKLVRRLKNVVPTMGPVKIPPEQRRLAQSAGDVILTSMIVLDVEARGGQIKEKVYVPFTQFAEVTRWGDQRDPGRTPATVNIPGVGRFGLLMSTVKRELPAEVTLKAFRAEKYPGAASTYMDYFSTLVFKDKKSGATSEQVIHLNEPGGDNGLTYFQAFWDGVDNATPERRFSVVGIANRPGVIGMIAGSALIILGIGYAFYAKPILLKKKKAELAAWAAGA